MVEQPDAAKLDPLKSAKGVVDDLRGVLSPSSCYRSKLT